MGETTLVSAPAAACFRHALGGEGRAAGKRTAVAAAPCARFTRLLGCFAKPSLTIALSPCTGRGAQLLPAGTARTVCAPAAIPSSSLKKTSSLRAALSSAVRIYTGNKKGFSFSITEFCSFPPNTPLPLWVQHWLYSPERRSRCRASGAPAAAHHPVRAPAGDLSHDLVRSKPRSQAQLGIIPFASGGKLSQVYRQQPRHLFTCSGLAESTIALECFVLGRGRQLLSYD